MANKKVLSLEELCNEMKTRYPLGTAYPWSITDFKEQNPDIDFPKSSKEITDSFVNVNGENVWMKKWDYFVYVMRGAPRYFDEPQFQYYLECVKNATSEPLQYYYQVKYSISSLPHDTAERFCQRNYGIPLAKLLYDKQLIQSEYELTTTILQSYAGTRASMKCLTQAVELPHLDNLSDYSTSFSKVEECLWIGRRFMKCCFQGLSEDIEALASKWGSSKTVFCRIKEASPYIVGVELLYVDIGVENPYSIDQAIQDFPQLKFVGFFEKSNIYVVDVVYSESGYGYITHSQFAGEYDHKNESSWHYERWPIDDYQENSESLASGEPYSVNYMFPYEKEWNDANYVRLINGQAFTVLNSAEMEVDIAQCKENMKKIPTYYQVSSYPAELTEGLSRGDLLEIKSQKGKWQPGVFVKGAKDSLYCGDLDYFIRPDELKVFLPITGEEILRHPQNYCVSVAEIVPVSQRGKGAKHPHFIVKVEKIK